MDATAPATVSILPRAAEEIFFRLLPGLLSPSKTAPLLTKTALASIESDEFSALASRHRLATLLFNHLEKASKQANGQSPEFKQLSQMAFAARTRSLRRAAELKRVLQSFETEGMPVLVFKGLVLDTLLHGSIGLRHAGDLDLLVSPEHLSKAEQLVEKLGYAQGSSNFKLNSAEYKRSLSYGHAFEYYNQERASRLELHWRLVSNSNIFCVSFRELASRGQTLSVAGCKVQTLGNEDLLLYLFYHGGRHGWFRLFWLYDIARLVEGAQSDDWESFMRKAGKLGVTRFVLQGFALAQYYFQIPLPSLIEKQLEETPEIRWLVSSAQKTIKQAWTTELSFFELVQYTRYVMRLAPGLHYKLGELNRLISTPDDWATLPLPQPLFPLYYPLKPFLLGYRHLRRSLKNGSAKKSP